MSLSPESRARMEKACQAAWLDASYTGPQHQRTFVEGVEAGWSARDVEAEERKDGGWDGEENAIHLFHRERNARAAVEEQERVLTEALTEIASFTTQVGDTPHLVAIAARALAVSSTENISDPRARCVCASQGLVEQLGLGLGRKQPDGCGERRQDNRFSHNTRRPQGVAENEEEQK